MMPPRPWPAPGAASDGAATPSAGAENTAFGWTALARPLMPALTDRIMGLRSDEIEMPHVCRTCGHLWKSHVDGRCAHLFGMEGDFAHLCGCSPDEREVLYPLLPGELGPAQAQPIGIAAAVAAVAAVTIALRR